MWESYGRSGFMSDVDRADVLAARAKLAEFQLANTCLAEAVDFYILHKKPHGGDVTLEELFDKLIVERELSPRPPSPSYRRIDPALKCAFRPASKECQSGLLPVGDCNGASPQVRRCLLGVPRCHHTPQLHSCSQ